MNAKKSLIIVTYNRESLLKGCLESIDTSLFDKVVVVHDGGGIEYDKATIDIISKNFEYITFPENVGVAVCKQAGVDYVLTESDSEHIFIVEDDILVKDNLVWDYYIDFSKASGVHHTNWNDYRYSSTKFAVNFDGFTGIVTRDVEASFSYFNRNMFKFCEFPADMKNAFEHISVELQLIEKDLLPPFWNFVCPKDTGNYLTNVGFDSTITDVGDYTDNYSKANAAFIKRHGYGVNKIPDVGQEVVLSRLKFLKDNYGK